MRDAPFTIVETPDSRRCGLGAVVKGLDVSQPLPGETVAALREAALAFPVLVIPGQDLSPEALVRFARSFGELQPHTAERYRHPDFPELSYISNVDRDGKVDVFGQTKRATGWHSDGSFLEVPYSFTILYGLEVPSVGGPTLFANTTLAYERLDEETRRRADGATAIHAIGSGPEGAGSPSRQKRVERPDLFPDIEKPVVRVHPETGRKALFINPMHTSHIVGEDREEADALYARLIAFCTRPEFVYEHRWNVGDLVIWDQRCTLHRAGGGVAPNERRIMLRALVRGVQQAA